MHFNYTALTDIIIIQLVNSAKHMKPISLHCNDKFTDTALDVITKYCGKCRNYLALSASARFTDAALYKLGEMILQTRRKKLK